ncbi:MAG: F0F1 ATP synthase subunit B [Bacteroidales bacterium]|jgi:F-type H+-transporting ATPase subunit b|nr:F0F1 ATP synthase subunit B [Bacteroidales bacterium]NPV35393.1 F0F1 ATP synthase subunit B [Bacteroidales bacterium]
MELVKPDVGLIFWMTVSFGILLYILSRFAWPVIMKALREREQKISEALESAARARDEMARLKAENELILMQARQEREAMIASARKTAEKIVEESRQRAQKEYDAILAAAKVDIENAKQAALIELKNSIGSLSVEIAEKILRAKLSEEEKQSELIRKLVEEAQINH